MEVRIESMICVWDDKIPTLFLEFVNLLTLSTSEEGLRKSVKEFAEKHELDKFFLYGFGSHHFYLLENEKFRLYYTAEGEEAHNFIVVVEDNFGNSFELEFDFNNRNVKDDGLTIVPIGNFSPLLK
jgi:hypothetical protein